MRYMLQLCLHVRTGTQYRYCIHVCNTGTQYMSPVCLHVRTCMRIHVRNTGMQYMLQLCLHVCTGIAYKYAHAYPWGRRRGERWRHMLWRERSWCWRNKVTLAHDDDCSDKNVSLLLGAAAAMTIIVRRRRQRLRSRVWSETGSHVQQSIWRQTYN